MYRLSMRLDGALSDARDCGFEMKAICLEVCWGGGREVDGRVLNAVTHNRYTDIRVTVVNMRHPETKQTCSFVQQRESKRSKTRG